MIEAESLTKRYGRKTAVESLSFRVTPGRVTGFLGPNGAGKSTTIRMLLGLNRPHAGRATIDGRPYQDLKHPLHTVGALLETRAAHTGRSAYHHLLALAQSQGIGKRRVEEVLRLVGLSDVAHQRVGGYSLGMGQRLSLATAMLGDPAILVLDEPVNGLDAEGIVWIRTLMKDLAAEGRTVFVSSHLMNEMAVTADHVIVIGRGRLVADCPMPELIERSTETTVLVRSPDTAQLTEAITRAGGSVTRHGADELAVTNLDAARIAEIARAGEHLVHELSTRHGSLEEAFIELTRESVEYSGGTAAETAPGGAR